MIIVLESYTLAQQSPSFKLAAYLRGGGSLAAYLKGGGSLAAYLRGRGSSLHVFTI